MSNSVRWIGLFGKTAYEVVDNGQIKIGMTVANYVGPVGDQKIQWIRVILQGGLAKSMLDVDIQKLQYVAIIGEITLGEYINKEGVPCPRLEVLANHFELTTIEGKSFHPVTKKDEKEEVIVESIEYADEEEEFDQLNLDAVNEKHEFEEDMFTRYHSVITHDLPF